MREEFLLVSRFQEILCGNHISTYLAKVFSPEVLFGGFILPVAEHVESLYKQINIYDSKIQMFHSFQLHVTHSHVTFLPQWTEWKSFSFR